MPEQQYLLTVAYQAGRDERITKGQDGARDFFSPAELEKAAWLFMKSARDVGLFHLDGTTGCAQVVESYIWRGDDWALTAADGTEQIVKSGDWLVGLLCDDVAWNLYKSGRISGVSPQGRAARRRSTS
jgi:putative serine protease XkdF